MTGQFLQFPSVRAQSVETVYPYQVSRISPFGLETRWVDRCPISSWLIKVPQHSGEWTDCSGFQINNLFICFQRVNLALRKWAAGVRRCWRLFILSGKCKVNTGLWPLCSSHVTVYSTVVCVHLFRHPVLEKSKCRSFIFSLQIKFGPECYKRRKANELTSSLVSFIFLVEVACAHEGMDLRDRFVYPPVKSLELLKGVRVSNLTTCGCPRESKLSWAGICMGKELRAVEFWSIVLFLEPWKGLLSIPYTLLINHSWRSKTWTENAMVSLLENPETLLCYL